MTWQRIPRGWLYTATDMTVVIPEEAARGLAEMVAREWAAGTLVRMGLYDPAKAAGTPVGRLCDCQMRQGECFCPPRPTPGTMAELRQRELAGIPAQGAPHSGVQAEPLSGEGIA